MTSDEQKPMIGWVAWHPEEGFASICECEGVVLTEDIELLAAYVSIRAIRSGWRIRPAELRFTDTEGRRYFAIENGESVEKVKPDGWCFPNENNLPNPSSFMSFTPDTGARLSYNKARPVRLIWADEEEK